MPPVFGIICFPSVSIRRMTARIYDAVGIHEYLEFLNHQRDTNVSPGRPIGYRSEFLVKRNHLISTKRVGWHFIFKLDHHHHLVPAFFRYLQPY